ncbi:MAG: hypothetical protein JSV27_02485 [Candidatus Bathyarchaeota archaeon]|nr:MAG: hypothetical protein JSV27_02485 [Candidatus Bathyarchaeota archaeon]
MVKVGSAVKNYRLKDSDPETIQVGRKVYFPEIDDEGNIDLSNWCLRRSEAEFKEKWFKYIRKLQSEYQRLEERKAEFWEITSEELGLMGTSLDPAPLPILPEERAKQEESSESE